jgi:YrbI family 3-deoxy-D-manno-octulosonate 8-phosphate phosphatase
MIPHKIFIDCDGVLTDGKQNITHDGKELFKSFHNRDTAAIRELVARGYDVTIITASSSPIIKQYAEKTGVSLRVLRNKAEAADGAYIAIGDSAWDIPMFDKAAKSFCPADASAIVRALPNMHVLQTKGGRGVIEELVSIICK